MIRRDLLKALPAILLVKLPKPVIAAELPRDSVYQLDAMLQDQNGKRVAWESNRGQPRIVTMFYSSCPHTCPLIVEAIKSMEAGLPAASRARLKVDMISFDTTRDTPEKLKTMAISRSVDESRWHLYRADEAKVRQLSGLLGIQYRQLADGEFNHSSVMILLDAQGRIEARSDRIGADDPKFVLAVARSLAR
jgi:protein SCO1